MSKHSNLHSVEEIIGSRMLGNNGVMQVARSSILCSGRVTVGIALHGNHYLIYPLSRT